MCARSKIGQSETVSPAVESKYQLSQKLKKQKRIAMQQHQSNIQRESCAVVNSTSMYSMNQDLLALSTIYYRMLLCAITDAFTKFQETNIYRILFCTTQPAHVVTLISVAATAILVSPYKSNESSSTRTSPLLNLVYLTAFMMHFGAQMWMTFVSGLSLYFAVPRHTFGEVQKVLFPKYFGMNSILSAITLFIFLKLHPSNTWDSNIAIQVGAMILCFLLELIIRLYLTPPMLKLIAAKNAMETAAGVGLEIGKHDPGLLAHCPHYIKIHRTFRRIHMTVAMGNLLTMACTLLHAHYLASKICML